MIAAILFDARGSTYLDIGSNFASCHRQINPAFSSFIRARIIRVAIEWERSGRVNNFCRCRRARVHARARPRAPAPCACTVPDLIPENFFAKKREAARPRIIVRQVEFACGFRPMRKIKRRRNFIGIKRASLSCMTRHVNTDLIRQNKVQGVSENSVDSWIARLSVRSRDLRELALRSRHAHSTLNRSEEPCGRHFARI